MFNKQIEKPVLNEKYEYCKKNYYGDIRRVMILDSLAKLHDEGKDITSLIEEYNSLDEKINPINLDLVEYTKYLIKEREYEEYIKDQRRKFDSRLYSLTKDIKFDKYSMKSDQKIANSKEYNVYRSNIMPLSIEQMNVVHQLIILKESGIDIKELIEEYSNLIFEKEIKITEDIVCFQREKEISYLENDKLQDKENDFLDKINNIKTN